MFLEYFQLLIEKLTALIIIGLNGMLKQYFRVQIVQVG